MRGRGRQDIGGILQGSGAGGPTLQALDMGDVPMHWENSGRISPPFDTLTDGVAADMEGGWYLGLPTSGGGNSRGGFGGGGYLCRPPPKHSCTVHNDHIYCGYLSGGRAVSGGMGDPEVVGEG